MKCSQCDKPAIVSFNKVNLCVDCYYKFQQATAIQMNTLMTNANFLLDQMDAVTGIQTYERYEVSTPVINKGPITLNNLNIEGSMVGVINTGVIANLDALITQIKEAGQDTLATEIKKLTEEIVKNTEADNELKKIILEQLSFLMNEIKTPTQQRNKSVISAVLEKLNKTLSTISSLITIWGKLSPLLEKFFEK